MAPDSPVAHSPHTRGAHNQQVLQQHRLQLLVSKLLLPVQILLLLLPVQILLLLLPVQVLLLAVLLLRPQRLEGLQAQEVDMCRLYRRRGAAT